MRLSIHAVGEGDSSAVLAGSPAAKAGRHDGDVVIALDGQAIDPQHQLDLLLLQR